MCDRATGTAVISDSRTISTSHQEAFARRFFEQRSCDVPATLPAGALRLGVAATPLRPPSGGTRSTQQTSRKKVTVPRPIIAKREKFSQRIVTKVLLRDVCVNADVSGVICSVRKVSRKPSHSLLLGAQVGSAGAYNDNTKHLRVQDVVGGLSFCGAFLGALCDALSCYRLESKHAATRDLDAISANVGLGSGLWFRKIHG